MLLQGRSVRRGRTVGIKHWLTVGYLEVRYIYLKIDFAKY